MVGEQGVEFIQHLTDIREGARRLLIVIRLPLATDSFMRLGQGLIVFPVA